MKDTSASEQCTAYFEEHRRERPAGHSKKHRDGAMTWTDAGVERLRQEREQNQAAKAARAGKSDHGRRDLVV
jgi:hypothetical protein